MTTVVRTVVKTTEPRVITVVERGPSSKGKGSTPGKAAARDDGDHEDEDHEDEDHEDEDHEDEDHED